MVNKKNPHRAVTKHLFNLHKQVGNRLRESRFLFHLGRPAIGTKSKESLIKSIGKINSILRTPQGITFSFRNL